MAMYVKVFHVRAESQEFVEDCPMEEMVQQYLDDLGVDIKEFAIACSRVWNGGWMNQLTLIYKL